MWISAHCKQHGQLYLSLESAGKFYYVEQRFTFALFELTQNIRKKKRETWEQIECETFWRHPVKQFFWRKLLLLPASLCSYFSLFFSFFVFIYWWVKRKKRKMVTDKIPTIIFAYTLVWLKVQIWLSQSKKAVCPSVRQECQNRCVLVSTFKYRLLKSCFKKWGCREFSYLRDNLD